MTEDTRTDGGTATDGGPAGDASGTASAARADGGHASGELPAGEHHDDHAVLPGYGTVRRWLVTTNHKDVGVLYTVTAMFYLLLGGTLALLFRMNLLTAGSDGLLAATSYFQAVSIHGLVMVFWFLSPVAFGLANYMVPLQIGAEDLAFPRLNAMSYWLYLFSGLMVGASFFMGGSLSGGWTLYMPLSVPAYMPQVGATAAIFGLTLFVASVTLGSVNFLTTIHRMRAEGMRIRDLPLFSQSILLTVWMMLLAFAALLAALVILGSDHVIGTTYFSAQEGGSLLWAHLFWFFGHPEVYIVFFPALGIMAEVFQTFSGRRIVGRKWFIAAMVLVALQSFVVWMHHMFLTSINLQIKTLFMATTIGISLPFDLMVFALIYTMMKGRIRFTTPFLFNFGALVLFIVGGITGVFLGAVVLDYEFRGTYWVVAHFHYVMVGGATAIFGGIYYWFPKITGKMYDEYLGKLHFAAYFVGFNLLYFPLFVAWETPRRVFEYQPDLAIWHQLATVGGFVLGASFLIMFYNLGKSVYTGPDAGENPWAYTSSAEWAVSSPPPLENWPGLPSYKDGSLNFLRSTAPDGGAATGPVPVVSDPERSSLLAHHEELHPDHASIWPFAVSLAAALAFLGFSGMSVSTFTWPLMAIVPISLIWMGVVLARREGAMGWVSVALAFVFAPALYLWTIVDMVRGRAERLVPGVVASLGFVVGAFLLYEYVFGQQVTGLEIFPGPSASLGAYGALALVGVALGSISLVELGAESFEVPEPPVASTWPFDGVEKTKLGMWFFLASDVVLFGGFIGSYLFIRFAYGWQHWHDYVPAEHVTLPGLLNTYILLVSSFAVVLALVAAEKNSRAGVVASLATTILLGMAFLVNKAIEWLHLFHVEWLNTAGGTVEIVHGWTYATNIASSTFYLTTGLHGAHVTVGLLILVWMTARAARGAYLDDETPIEYFGLYWHFVDIVWLFLFPLFYIV